MSFNTFGKIFRFTTWGESHGPAIGCVVDGCPPNIALSEKDIQIDMNRRRPGKSKFTSQRKESDKVEILSGIFQGKTTGTPISMIIYNKDARSRDYETIKNKFRPGHADYTYLMKYGIRDYRGGGRQSARETASRVAAGAIAKVILNKLIGKRFKIVGGADQLSFKITQLGELSFVREPDYEKPLDKNGDNIYIVNYLVIDSKNKNLSTMGSAQITIKDSEEKPIASLDKRKYIAWTVDHMPYHILMEDAIIDYNDLNSDEYTKSIKQKKGRTGNKLWLPELRADDELIIVQKKANKEEILFWNKTIENLNQTDQDLNSALILMKKYKAIEETLALANQYCSEAINALEVFPPSEEKLALESLAKISGLFDTEKKQEQLTVWTGFTDEQMEALQSGQKAKLVAHGEKEDE